MRYVGTYALLLTLHLVGVLVIVGPLGMVTSTAGRLAREGDVPGLTRALRTTRVFSLASLVVVVLGTLMLEREPWDIPRGAAWVSASYALWLVAVALNLAVLAPALKEAIAAAGASSDRVARKIGAVGGLSALCWVAIVVLMVYKPGQ